MLKHNENSDPVVTIDRLPCNGFHAGGSENNSQTMCSDYFHADEMELPP